MNKGKERVLFLFTKQFPFSGGESYIDIEVPFLCRAFDKVILVPTDFFGTDHKHKRTFPANVEVLCINSVLHSVPKNRGKGTLELIKIMLAEFIQVNTKLDFVKNLFWFLNVLRHHQAIANALDKMLKSNYAHSDNYFYSYWMHQAVISLGILKQRNSIQKIVARAHSLDLYQEDWGYLKGLQVPGFKMFKILNTDKIYSVSEHGKKYFLDKYPSLKSKFERSYLGVADFGEGPFNEENVFTLITCSNFSLNKRMGMIPDILQHIDFPLHWIAFGDGVEQSAIDEKIKRLPGNIQVSMMGDVPNSELIEFYKMHSLNLYVNLSIAEGLPVSLMEAASFGIPMIATDVYGNPEIVIHKETGFVIPKEFNPKEVALLIDELHKDKIVQRKFRAGARSNFLKNFRASMNYPSFSEEIQAK